MLSLHQKTSPGPVDVTFQNVSYEVQKTEKKFPFSRKKTTLKILHNVSGYVPGGSSLAILGPSGSGKTSLLNLLAARSEKPPTSGTILFSGRPRVPRTKRQIGYVMQDDVFFSKLTVRETLMFTADVRLPRTMTREQRTQRVDNVIKMLGLENCQNTRIGDQQFDKGISGGERKRVNIANELIHKPSLLLADECTSGLDSSSALSVINVLSQLCNEGHTVISTIHQPSSRMFFLFSRILILAEGRVAYFGAPNNVVSYLESLDFPFPGTAYNPADFALELVIDNEEKNGMPSPQQRIVCAWKTSRVDWISADSMQSPEHIELPMDYLCNQTKIHPEEGNVSDSTDPTTSIGQTDLSEPTMKPISTYRERMKRAVCKRFRQLMRRQDEFEEEKYTTSWWTQTAALAKRALRQKQGMLFRFIGLLQVFITTVLVLMFWFRSPPEESTVEDRFGLLSFININWAFYSISTAVFTFPKEKAVLTKDRASGIYRLSAYYFAKTIVCPFIVIFLYLFPRQHIDDLADLNVFLFLILGGNACGHALPSFLWRCNILWCQYESRYPCIHIV